MNNPNQRISSEDIDARLARYDQDQCVDNVHYSKQHDDSDDISFRSKKTTDTFLEDSCATSRVNESRHAYEENLSYDYRGNFSYISDETEKENSNSRMVFQVVPSTSRINAHSQYQPYSNREYKSVTPSNASAYSDSVKLSKGRRSAKMQELQYVDTTCFEMQGSRPKNRPEDFHGEDVWIRRKSNNYQNQFVSSEHSVLVPASDQTIDYVCKNYGIEQEFNSKCSKVDSNSRSEQKSFMYLNPTKSDYAKDYITKISGNFKDPKEIAGCSRDSFYVPEHDESHVYSKRKNDDVDVPGNSKNLNTKFWQRSDNSKDSFDSDNEEYCNVYLDNQSSPYSKSIADYRSKFSDSEAFRNDCSYQSSHKIHNTTKICNLKSCNYDSNNFDYYPERDHRSKKNQKHLPSNYENQESKMYETHFSSRYLNTEPRFSNNDISRKDILIQQKGKKKVRIRRHAWDDDVFPISEANNMEENVRFAKISRTNTFTMHDAYKIAPLFAGSSMNYHFDQTDGCPTDENEDNSNYFRVKRKCWTKACWSTTFHTHTSLSNKVRSLAINRNALLNSMESPQYATKSKKQTFSDCSCLKTSLDRFQLFNSTLKKIEGQFGTGVVSYFVFLRWLIILNFVIFLLYFLLVILPHSAFALLSQVSVKSAPNTTLLTEEYLQRFPTYENQQPKKRSTGFENVSFSLGNDLFEEVSTLIDNYAPDELLDLALRYDKRNFTREERQAISRKCEARYKMETANGTKGGLSYLQDFLQGTGWLQSTILFLGSYPDRYISYFGLRFNLPVSFIAVLFVSFFLSIVLMVQFSSSGIHETILSRKSNYLTFSNILFCSWDYCIEDKKTADIRHKSITCELKSNLTEEHRKSEVKSWSTKKKIKVYLMRAVVHIFVLLCLFGCFYFIYRVVNFQLEKQRQNALTDAGVYTLCIQFLPSIVITVLNIVMPIIFNNLGRFELYDTRTQVNIALLRVVILRLASVFVLVSSLYQQITCEPKDDCKAGKSEYCRSPICWETYVGQQLYKLVVTDFLVYICMFLGYDLPRDLVVQKCKCKVTEVIGRQVFDLPSQVLSLVYSQTLCWLGIFYSPLLPGITVIKFLIVFYVKKIVVLKHCIPAPVLYKASRSNSIFMMILMISLFAVTIIHGYSLSSIEPSPGCSPFRQYFVIINAIPNAISDWSPGFVSVLSFVFSGFFFIPSFLLLSILIYYYWTVVVAQRQLTKVLKAQIAIEGRDKQFLLNRLAGVAKEAASAERY